MKIAIELPDSLAKKAKRIALERGQSLQDVMIDALGREVKQVKKNELLNWIRNLQKEFKDAGWMNADKTGWQFKPLAFQVIDD